jgi:hypothetical protein
LPEQGFTLVHGPRLKAPDQRQGGAFDILAGTPGTPFGSRVAMGTVTWVEDAQAGIGNVKPRPDGPYGAVFGLKATYECKKCAYRGTLLLATLLQYWLNAVIRNDRQIELQVVTPSPESSKLSLEWIADRGSVRAWSTRRR